MDSRISRRDFLKFGGMAFGGLVLTPFLPGLTDFDDSNVIRIATKSVSVYSKPSDESVITGTWYRDDLVHVYGEVKAREPKHNPIWLAVWGGYIHRGRIQRVRTIYQQPVAIPDGTRRLAEVTVPFTEPYRYIKSSQKWEMLTPPLYYGSVHWVDQLAEEGPDGTPNWYRILDELDSNVSYYVRAIHMRLLPLDVFDPITPEVPYEEKLIEVNLATQTLAAYEYGKTVFQTNISSGIPGGGESGPNGLSTTTPNGRFEIIEKVPSKHMGNSYFNIGQNGNLLADADGYVLPGVPWTSFFTRVGHAFHGTYWHENFGTPMSHGCINMRSNEANWLYRWARPPHDTTSLSNHSARGTQVEIHY
jgi:lipoprotein-anchoring transpeptidase ErfK/SrfK